MENLNRDQLIYMAKICEQSERFKDMLVYMKQVLATGKPLSVEERNLLSVAYKNSVGVHRSAWRILESIGKKEKEKNKDGGKNFQLIQQYKQDVETELNTICNEIIASIDE